MVNQASLPHLLLPLRPLLRQKQHPMQSIKSLNISKHVLTATATAILFVVSGLKKKVKLFSTRNTYVHTYTKVTRNNQEQKI